MRVSTRGTQRTQAVGEHQRVDHLRDPHVRELLARTVDEELDRAVARGGLVTVRNGLDAVRVHEVPAGAEGRRHVSCMRGIEPHHQFAAE